MKLVIGENNRIGAGLSDVQVIGNNIDVTEDNQTILRHVTISDTDLKTSMPVEAPIRLRVSTETADFDTSQMNDVYFVGTSGGDVTVTLLPTTNRVVVIKTTAANKVMFTSSGTTYVNDLITTNSSTTIYYNPITNTYFGI